MARVDPIPVTLIVEPGHLVPLDAETALLRLPANTGHGHADGEGSTEGHRALGEGFPTCGLALLHYAGRWADLDYGDARLERFHVARG